MTPLPVTWFTATSALGRGIGRHLDALRDGAIGLTPCDFETARLPTFTGHVGELPPLDAEFAGFDCRNNRLAEAGITADGFAGAARRCVERVGARRVALLLGTSTSGILETEQAYRRLDPVTGALPDTFRYETVHSTYATARFLRQRLGIAGPSLMISTACSSSAKVFATAARWIDAGLVDAAVVGGVDSLCLTTLHGFHSLQLTAPEPCRPFDATRDGISIGEAAAFALLERDPPDELRGGSLLLGCGESSDAHHMSAPHPTGLGAQLAMRAALADAGLPPERIDYLNCHGTGTPANDLAEGLAIEAVFGRDGVACSSTKGLTGHTLGAAGALEAAICLIAIEHGFIPGGVPRQAPDPKVHVDYRSRSTAAVVHRAMTSSFGFGGSNCALVFGAET